MISRNPWFRLFLFDSDRHHQGVSVAARIRILPESITNKIAAGEVVERPASVVKELVENALDAGSTDIVAEIEGGGKRLIRVTDNGSGMSRDDALLALERHATSKIASDSDLFNLGTLGFRGEALPSIASVSRFTIQSRERGSMAGAEIYAEGGRIREVKEFGMAEGTVIAVRNLFFNTPARLKFMKSPETEAGHVGEFLTRLALSRPEVRFTYLNDGKMVFRALPGTLQSRAAELLGKRLARDLYPFNYGDEPVSMHGLVGGPACSRSSAGALYTYINGRFVRDRVVQHAVLQGYRQVLERGRYPVVVLFVDLPPGEVDVNVHPTKHEVRFREQGRVHDIIQGGIEAAIRSAPWLEEGRRAARDSAPVSAGQEMVARVRDALQSYAQTPHRQESFPRAWSGGQPTGGTINPGSWVQPPAAVEQPPLSTQETERAVTDAALAKQPASEVCPEVGYFSSLTVIGQFNAAYILCQEGGDLVMIDQHAAHERVAFERLRVEYASGGIERQGLLFPETLELSPAQSATAREHSEEFLRLGFELDHFGGNTWLLKAVPRLIARLSADRTVLDMLEELQGIGRSRSMGDLVEGLLATIACHSVVRGRQNLTVTEIRELFRQMDAIDFATRCPHGRPVIATITLADIEKMFKRT
jgi:DNA mismatch repair protein MutL